jgi:Zinc carboxypeptidase
MRFRTPRLSCLIVFMILSCGAAWAAPPTPESYLGHPVGADRKLAGWKQITGYFQALDQSSDRVQVVEVGRSTLDRPIIMAVISSAKNLENAARYREISRRLADPRGLSDAEAEQLIAEGKTIVLVTCNIHSSEIGASQMAMEWAWQLATRDDPEVRQWLDDVILLLMPSINPDGTDMIVDYYREYLGTEWEGGRLPWLYHHYAGHDNNRDWYMLNLVETRAVNHVLHHEWFPQAFLDEHQMGMTGPRIFVPPYVDPHTTLAHPMQWRLNDLVGTHMALRLEEDGKRGVIDSYAYDAYWPGGTKNTACLKNVVGLLTEVSSCRIATPVWVDPNELSGNRKGLPDYKAQMNFPNPWPGGWWRLRDIVDYELIASNSLIETCSRYRVDLLRAFWRMGKEEIARGTEQAPYAYVIPPNQNDPGATSAMVDILRENGLEAHVAESEIITRDGRRFPGGSAVFLSAQPYRPFLIEMLERQRYPEVRQGPDTKEIFRPYDVTAWTLPLLMGVEWARIDEPFDVPLRKIEAPEKFQNPTSGNSPAVVIRGAEHRAASVVNALLKRGVRVERARAAFQSGGRNFNAGDFIVPGGALGAAAAEADENHVTLYRLGQAPPAGNALEAPRVAMYKPWIASMDEGWTRMVLDRHGFEHTSLDNAAIKQKNLRAKFDVIILPSETRSEIVDGKPKTEGDPTYFEPLPPKYAGGIGKDGVESLKAFVEQGGTLICLSESCEVPLIDFNLPVRSTVSRLKREDYSVPGTLVNLEVDPADPIGYGMPAKTVAWYSNGPVFATAIPGAYVGRTVVARFPAHPDQIVASGWADGTENMTGRAAIVTAQLGKGRVVLFGPRVQHRGQTVGTYKLLFNAIYLAGMDVK